MICPQVVVLSTQVGNKASTGSPHTRRNVVTDVTEVTIGTVVNRGEGIRVKCPFCREDDSRVVDSRTIDEGLAIRRRRECGSCGRRFTTAEFAALSIVKRSGATEAFNRLKVVSGVRKACQGRPVSEDDLAVLAQRVEDNLRASGNSEIPAQEVGLAILAPLRELDEVAYLRFASVYRSFDTLEDFEAEIALLRAEGEPTGQEPIRTSHTTDSSITP